MMNLDPVIIVVIALNVIVSLKGFNDFSFFEKYKFNIGGIRRGEQIRMLTSGFLHVDTMHLFFNMFTLYFFAPEVIKSLGGVKFLIIYFGSLLVGNLFSLFFHKDEYHYSAVGASGAVSGIIYAGILFRPDMSLYLMFIPIPIPAYIFGIGYLLYSIFGMKTRTGNIGHDAHFGGAVGGYVITLLFMPSLIEQNTLMVGLLAIPIIILFIMQRLGKL
ncbi:rhomboid family intramembrane serine protease [Aquimarina sp. 2201CG5-10]|uniref:rhomboid family intramembrane serine protease n=1 Tax=Aquimarina callyspongiae TaxID=3098150 RepID=UPI002AB5AA0C|nr:rhomboid family intramembrane serine protease [Aquimarina sp. 2201CG5-10]MDY8138942.1 rhomboid family intramembrane serine protease [Aquimarina sp. 2201CG5-10]